LEKFERQIDPDGILPEKERRQRAISARRAYMLQLAKRSATARRIKTAMGMAEAEAPVGRDRQRGEAEPEAE
jgi:hypothetical protein